MAHDQEHSARINRLLREARSDIPTAEEQQALQVALTDRIARGAQGDTLPFDVPPARSGISTLARTAIGGALFAGVTLLAILSWPEPAPTPTSTVSRDTRPVTKILAPGEVGAPHETQPSAPTAQQPAVPQAAPPTTRQVKASGSRTPPRSGTAGPTESRLIEGARSLVRSDPKRALALTEQHLRLYHAGELAPEREVLAIEALARLGRRTQAIARANAFRMSHPGSIHASRIEAALADKKSPTP